GNSFQPGRRETMTTDANSGGFHPEAAEDFQDGNELFPKAGGLFDPLREHDACGVGFIADLKGLKSHRIVKDALYILENLEHRGAVGAAPIPAAGAGLSTRVPHD